MRHRVASKHFSRTTNQRKALFRGLVVSLIEHERIETTVAKAKEIRKHIERMVTLAKRGNLHSKRMAFAYVPNRKTVAKLFSEIAPRFSDRNGGYVRIIRTRNRLKDQAEMAVIEFIDYEERRSTSEKKSEKKVAESKEE